VTPGVAIHLVGTLLAGNRNGAVILEPGGFELPPARATLTNCVVVGNTGANSILLATGFTVLRIDNSTIVKNHAGGWEAYEPAACVANGGSDVRIRNSILWDNRPVDVRSATDTVIEDSIVGHVHYGSSTVIDPAFVRLPDPGFGGWDGVDDDYGDLRLRGGSPAIDAGNNASVPVGFLLDAAQSPRFADDPCTTDTGAGSPPIVDLGAYEFTAPSTCGDGACGPAEDCGTCPCDCGSCCGNGLCEAFETCLTCAADCPCTTLRVPGDYASIQLAINAARNGDTVLVDPGTYVESIDLDSKSIILQSRDGAVVTTIDGSGSDRSVVVYGASVPSSSVLQGFTVTRGAGISTPPWGYRSGGGIYCVGASLSLRECRITDNSAYDGAGVWARGEADLDVLDSHFEGNEAAYEGGGILVDDQSNFAVSGSTFVRNEAQRGGAIRSEWGSGVITGCTFHENRGYHYGGAVASNRTTIVISDCLFTANMWNTIDLRLAGASVFNCVFVGDTRSTNNVVWIHDVPCGFSNNTVVADTLLGAVSVACAAANNIVWGLSDGEDPTLPLFVRYPDDGGDGFGDQPYTSGVDEGANDDFGDLRLVVQSPMVDAGSNGSVQSEFDFLGGPRILDGNGDGDPVVDMGAYEMDELVCNDPDGTPCDDGLFCTTGETCQGGTCRSGFPLPCDDGIGCTIDQCDEIANACVYTTDDSVCSDGDCVNGEEVCVVGIGCQPGVPPPDDCDGNGLPDLCELQDGAPDCNENGTLDVCDPDCNGDGIPDDCPMPLECSPPIESARFAASDPRDYAELGWSVDIDGNTAVVGAHKDDTNGVDAGAAYVYEFDGRIWIQTAKLLGSDTTAGDQFGYAVAVAGNTIVIGAPFAQGQSSGWTVAYLFERQSETDPWVETYRFTEDVPFYGGQYGASVAIDGDTVVIGAPDFDTSVTRGGRVFVYSRDLGGSGAWGLGATLEATATDHDFMFGIATAVSGDFMLIGSSGDPEHGVEAGAAYVFERSPTYPGYWVRVTKLASLDIDAGDHFGASVALDGDTAVVGAPHTDTAGTRSGTVYVFERGASWGQTARLSVPETVAFDEFGNSVAVEADLVVIGVRGSNRAGAASGAVHFFRRDTAAPNGWAEDPETLYPIDHAAVDLLGQSVAVSRGVSVIGSPGSDHLGVNQGRAYVFEFGDRDCNCNGVGDRCELLAGAVDVNENATLDECECLSSTPVAFVDDEPTRNRFVAIRPGNAAGPTAIRVRRSVDGVPTGDPPLWLGPPTTYPEYDWSLPAGTFKAAYLQCEPTYVDWGTLDVVYAFGAEIVPDGEYMFDAYRACGAFALGEPVPSAAVVGHTGQWGDVDELRAGPGVPQQPDFRDIAAIVLKFRGDAAALSKTYTQLQPNIPIPTRAVDFRDVSATVAAFVGTAYADLGGITGPCTCPSTMPCGQLSCANDLQCGPGFCIDGFCTDACGRCTPP